MNNIIEIFSNWTKYLLTVCGVDNCGYMLGECERYVKSISSWYGDEISPQHEDTIIALSERTENIFKYYDLDFIPYIQFKRNEERKKKIKNIIKRNKEYNG